MTIIDLRRPMALNAIQTYHAEVCGGGEPVYPNWADDMLSVCQLAERNTEAKASQYASEALQQNREPVKSWL